MLITEKVEVVLTSNMMNYYEKLGYKIPKRVDKYGKMRMPTGTKLLVTVIDLPNSSDTYITVKCDYCGKEFKKQYKQYMKGRKNIQKDACEGCCHLKRQEVIKEKYGVNSCSQIPGVGSKIGKKRTKYDIKEIAKEFAQNNYLLISDKYKNCDEKLRYICLKHTELGIQEVIYKDFQRNYSGCKLCKNEKISNSHKIAFSEVEKEFNKRNYKLETKEYDNCKISLEYICNKHPYRIQSVTFDNLKTGKQKCHYCTLEETRNSKDNQQIDISDLFDYLRSKISEWKQFSIKECSYKCVITGEHFDVIHHLYSFHKIVYETLTELHLPLYRNFKEYSKEEIRNIENKCLELHYKYGNGVCLKNEIHELFHHTYGYSDNSKEQFEEFLQKFKKGELVYRMKEVSLG